MITAFGSGNKGKGQVDLRNESFFYARTSMFQTVSITFFFLKRIFSFLKYATNDCICSIS